VLRGPSGSLCRKRNAGWLTAEGWLIVVGLPVRQSSSRYIRREIRGARRRRSHWRAQNEASGDEVILGKATRPGKYRPSNYRRMRIKPNERALTMANCLCRSECGALIFVPRSVTYVAKRAPHNYDLQQHCKDWLCGSRKNENQPSKKIHELNSCNERGGKRRSNGNQQMSQRSNVLIFWII
jgi:hypothetical protein